MNRHGSYQVACLAVLSLWAAAAGRSGPAQAAGPASQPAGEYARLIERIAAGDEDEAVEAADLLIERVCEPLAQALVALDRRPPEQQRRVLEALGRVTAVLRLRVYRAGLPAEERELFDQALARDRVLVEQLFDDDPQRRTAALHQIPLEPGGYSGVLIVSRVYDSDALVADAALERAADLSDAVVARGLTRYLGEITAAVSLGRLGANAGDVAVVFTTFARKAIAVLGAARAAEGVPTIIAAMRCFGRPPFERFFIVAEACEALGAIGDEQATDVLLEYLHSSEVHQTRSADGNVLKQTVGDVALLALLRIYGQAPEALGYRRDAAGKVYGFADQQARTTAVSTFGEWLARNRERPPAERDKLTMREGAADQTAQPGRKQP